MIAQIDQRDQMWQTATLKNIKQPQTSELQGLIKKMKVNHKNWLCQLLILHKACNGTDGQRWLYIV